MTSTRTVLQNNNDNDLGNIDSSHRSGFVSIIGNANVGKSTLINSLLGEKLCIVSHKPQTTRHRILGVITESNYQLIFSDTPGMMKPAYKLQEAMMDSVRSATGDADVIILVTDVYGEDLIEQKMLGKLQVTDRPIIIVVNKMDIIDNSYTSKSNENNTIDINSLIGISSNGINNTQDSKGKKMSLKERLLSRKNKSNSNYIESEYELEHNTNNEFITEQLQLTHSEGVEVIFDPETGLPIRSHAADITTTTNSHTNMNDYKGANIKKQKFDFPSKPKEKSRDELVKIWAERLPRANIMFISAQYELGVNELRQWLVQKAPSGPRYFPKDTLTTRDERFFASEIIRESLFHTYKDEIPYSCEVRIDSFQDKKKGKKDMSVIEATILVSRDSQKSILIGKGGEALKGLGIMARQKLSEFLDREVYLQLLVKTDKNWRQNIDTLTRLGYIESDYN